MSGEVVCPSCGKGNERSMAETYRVCVHCGGDLGEALTGPIQDTARPQQPYGAPPPQQPYGAPPPQQPYGAPPPAQPYGAPYPAAPYGAPAYPQPPMMMGPPSFHPEAYARPEEPPRLDIGNLFRVLFSPKAAFQDLYNHSSTMQGVLLCIVFTVLSGIISFALLMAVIGDMDIPEEAQASFAGVGTANAVSMVLNLVLSIVMFLFAGWLVFAFLKGPGKARRPSFEKTIGLIGYAKFPAFILGILIAVIYPVMLNSMDLEELEDPDADPTDALGTMCGALAGIMVISVIMLIWGLYVHSHAASVANDVSLGTAFGFTLLAWIITFIIMIAIVIVAALVGIGLTAV